MGCDRAGAFGNFQHLNEFNFPNHTVSLVSIRLLNSDKLGNKFHMFIFYHF